MTSLNMGAPLFDPLEIKTSALRAYFARGQDKSKSILDEFFIHPDSEAGQASALSLVNRNIEYIPALS